MSHLHIHVPMTLVRGEEEVEVLVDVEASRHGTSIDVGAPDDFGFAEGGLEVELTADERADAAARAERQVHGWTVGRGAP